MTSAMIHSLMNTNMSIVDETVEGVWEVCDEEDLLDEISACTGWCIKSIDYRNILTGAVGGWA